MAIKIGEKSPKTLKSEEIGQQYRQSMNNKADAAAAASAEQARLKEAATQTQQEHGITPKTVEEEKAALSHENETLTRIMSLPKEEQPQALREAGFPLLADQKAKEVAEAVEREKRLAEIMAMPEEARIGELLEAGFMDEAAAENKRISNNRKWSAVIKMLQDYGFIDLKDEKTSILEEASVIEDFETRIAFCKEHGFSIVGEIFAEALNGTPLSKIDKSLSNSRDKTNARNAEKTKAKAEVKAVDQGNAETKEEPVNTDDDGTPETQKEAPAPEEKKKPGRPAGSTKKN